MADATATLYRALVDDEEDHGCGDLPDEACREIPENAATLIGSLTLTKLGDRVVDPKTVLAWLVTTLGAPLGVVALLVPVREAGALIPQATLVPLVRRLAVRKWAWVAGSVGQALAVLAMAWAAATLEGPAVGWAVLGAVAVFALARSVASISSKDVLGKTVPKGRRGSVTGVAASAAGVATIAVGLLIVLTGGEGAEPTVLVWLLVGAATAWVLAAVVFATITEYEGEHDRSVDVGSIGDALTLVGSDADFRRFVVVRALLFVTALSPPFIVAMAVGVDGGSAALGPFVIASGVVSFIGSPVWGRLADRSSRLVMGTAAAAGAVAVAAFLALAAIDTVAAGPWLYVGAYALVSVAHSGARVGRKTYVVDLAAGNRRTDYVAVSNTVIGLLLLVVGGLGALAGRIGPEWALAALALLGVLGAVLARTLPEVSDPG